MTFRHFMALAALLCGAAQAAAPAYNVTGIVNASNYAPGPFAPNSVVSIFGSGLARSTEQLGASVGQTGIIPTELNYTQVFIDDSAVPLIYVSDAQINFLVPSRQSVGPAVLRVVREGNSGPEVIITLVDAAPALFTNPTGYAIATHADNSLVTPDSPARAGEIIVVYATGLGKTVPNTANQTVPHDAATIAALSSLQVTLDGAAVDPMLIKYAGVTPGSAGLYQINIELPAKVNADPECRVTVAGQSSPAGLKLAVH